MLCYSIVYYSIRRELLRGSIPGGTGLQRSRRPYTILYYTILYYTRIHYTILYYTILHYTNTHYNKIPGVQEKNAQPPALKQLPALERMGLASEAWETGFPSR